MHWNQTSALSITPNDILHAHDEREYGLHKSLIVIIIILAEAEHESRTYHPHLAGKRFTVAVLGHLVFGIKRRRAHLMLFGWLPPLLLLPLETCCEHPLVTRAGRNRFTSSTFFSRPTECEDASYKSRWTRSWCWQEGLLLISVHSVRGSDEPINTNVRQRLARSTCACPLLPRDLPSTRIAPLQSIHPSMNVRVRGCKVR